MAYQEERERQETEMENVTGLWPAEVEIYKAEHDMITFKKWLQGAGRRW